VQKNIAKAQKNRASKNSYISPTEEALADKIYCKQENRASLKPLGITLRAKPLGRPLAMDVEKQVPSAIRPDVVLSF